MNEEIIVNLWAFYNAETGFVYKLAGRAYNTVGTDREKLDILKSLAATDYRMAYTCDVPAAFHLGGGKEVSKLAPLHAVKNFQERMFEDVFNTLNFAMPNSVHTEENQCIPQSPLCVTTILFVDTNGNIRPIITPEDSQLLQENEIKIHGF